MKSFIKLTITIFCLTLFIVCNKKNSITAKFHPNDPFKTTITAGELFEINANQDNVLEGKGGTIIVCPKGCFKNSSGEIIKETIKIELAEALTLEEMLLSNLCTLSDGKPLITDGMIYFNATSKNEQLLINKQIPVYIEIPTTNKKAGMMVYKGLRDENGNMNWIEPEKPENFLIIVDINSLDFLPKGFGTAVNNGLPFRNQYEPSKKLIDSLYFSLSVSEQNELIDGFIKTDFNENYYTVKGKDTDIIRLGKSDWSVDTAAPRKCGIDPAMINVISSEKYQNTFIATREFEIRLQAIFRTCDDAIMNIYIENLDKDMWEADEMAANNLKGTEHYQTFYNFSQQKLSNVKLGNNYARLLKRYFEKQLSIIKSQLTAATESAVKALQEENQKAKKIVAEYKEVLVKREKNRMETYGFTRTETGWINIDTGIVEKDWSNQSLEIVVNGGGDFDRVYTYVIYPSIKSLYRLNSNDNEQFYAGNDENKKMLMPNNKPATVITIGYKNEIPSFALKEFITGQTKFSVTTVPVSMPELKERIRLYGTYGKENEIDLDLDFMRKFYVEEKRRTILRNENELIERLRKIAFPCCIEREEIPDGRSI